MQRVPSIVRHALVVAATTTLTALAGPVTAQTAGFTPGTFNVGDNGAASYTIPLSVAPGTAGVEPKLALVYNSGGGNGRLGVGWALSGLSAITRCPQTLGQDGTRGSIKVNSSDRFCLDGQRLILSSSGTNGGAGTTYGSEREAFSRVTANGSNGTGPDNFEVRTKSGLIIEYGNTTDSKFIPAGGPGVLVWGVNKIRDTKGNYLTVTYTVDNSGSPADWYPTQVSYTLNDGAGVSSANQTVTFTYEARTDVVPAYVAGLLTKTTNRLISIKSNVAGSLTHEYRLAYGVAGSPARSRLTSVQECSGTGSCMPATTVNPQTSTATSLNATGSGAWWTAFGLSSPPANSTNIVGDYNGDGKMDVAGYLSGSTWRVCTSSGTNFSCTNRTAHGGGTTNNFVGDFNGDGLTDLMAFSSGTQWNVCLSNGAGFTCSLWAGHGGTQSNNLVGDFDGDGRTDIASFDTSVGQWRVCLSTGSSTSGFSCSYWGGPSSTVANTIIGDFDGDGRTDVAAYTGTGGQWQVCLSTSTSFDCGSGYWNSNISANVSNAASTTMVGDFNGDGKTDMAAYGSGSTWYVCLSTGAGFACDSPSINWRGVSNTITGDFNGDGRTDLLTVADNGVDWLVCFGLYSSGTSFSCVTQSSPSVSWLSGTIRDSIRVGDFNGDGMADIATFQYTTNDQNPQHFTYDAELDVGLNAALPPDVVTSLTNGLGHQTTISYLPLTKSTVYTKDSGANAAVFPDIDLQVPMQVVSTASTANGQGGWVQTNYTYGGAKINLRDGRGFEGFRWRTETPQTTLIKTQTTYRQDWPYTGMPSQITSTLSNGTTVIQNTTNSYANKVFTGCSSGPCNRYFPFVTQGTSTTRDLDNSFITTIQTNVASDGSQIDAYGNMLNVQVKNLTSSGTDEGFYKTTASTYDNDATNWLLGRLRTSSVTKTIPGGANETRSSYFEYDATSGLLTKEVVEPSSSTYCLVTTYGYDAFGHKSSATTRNCNGSSGEAATPTGDPVFSQRTSYSYSDTSAGCTAQSGYVQGRFGVRNVNALGHAECTEHDTRFGGTTKLIGPNGLVTTRQYDEFGRKTLETRADGTKTAWAYLVCSGAPCTTAAIYRVQVTPQDVNGTQSGPITNVYYDALNREVRTDTQGFDGTAIYKDTAYDSRGRVSSVSQPYYNGQTAYVTSYGYDDLDRVTSETLPTTSGGTAKKVTTYSGLTASQTLSNNGTTTNMPGGVTQTKSTTKNSQGQVVTSTDAQSNSVSFTYWPSGNVNTTTAASVVTTLSYDLRSRKTQMVDGDMGTWYYYYDALGQLIRQTDAKSQTTTMSFDLLGRMTNRSEADLVSNWYFDTSDGSTTCGSGGVTSLGKLCKATGDNGYVRTHSYDSVGRPSSSTTTIDTTYTVSYGYSATTGRLFQTTYPTGYAIQNLYNSYGYLSEIIDSGNTVSFWKANSLTASGKVLSETVSIFHDGSWVGTPTTRQYDALDRLTSTSTTDDAPATHQYTSTYDAIGNVLAKDDVLQANLTENFAYDSRNMLTGTSGSGFTTTSTNYGATGNISYKSNVGTYNYPSTSSAQPHAPSSITGTVISCTNPSFSYDLNGNMTSGLGRTYTYTSYNMPSRIVGTRTCGGTSYQYDYTFGPEHQRTKLVHSTAGTFVYLNPGAPGELFFEKEIQPGGLVVNRHYITAGGHTIGMYISRSNGVVNYRFYHHDQVNSVLMVTNGGGTFMEAYAYEAFGKRRNTNGTDDTSNSIMPVQTRRGFTSHEQLDEIGLVHMNGRIYDPVIAKFITPDPFIQNANDPASYNRYAYVTNNPLAFTDPSGYISVGSFKLSGQDIRTIAQVAITAYFGFSPSGMLFTGFEGAGFASAVTAGFAGGIVGSGTMEGGMHGAIGAGLAFGATAFAGVDGMGGAGIWAKDGIGFAAAHAAAGCISAASSGGGCGPAAAAGGFSAYASGNLPLSGAPGMVGASMIGGTASVIGGGKFANGATTGAFAYMASGGLRNAVGGGTSDDAPIGHGERLLKSLAGASGDLSFSPTVDYDRVQTAEIAYALDKLATAQGLNFLTSDQCGPERVMLARVLAGSSDKYTMEWYRHESVEMLGMREHYGLTGTAYVDANRAVHLNVLQNQGNSSLNLYPPSVVRAYPQEFAGPAWDKIRYGK